MYAYIHAYAHRSCIQYIECGHTDDISNVKRKQNNYKLDCSWTGISLFGAKQRYKQTRKSCGGVGGEVKAIHLPNIDCMGFHQCQFVQYDLGQIEVLFTKFVNCPPI